MIPRLLLLALVVCQLMWHGYARGHYLLAGVAALPLLAVLPGVARGRRPGPVVAGYLAVLYFVIATTELVATQTARHWPALQVALALAYLAWLYLSSRSRSRSQS